MSRNQLRNSAIRTALSMMQPYRFVIERAWKPYWITSWYLHNLSYQGDRDDLFIVSFPKSGTTLMQMLVYQLTTDGNISFEHIRQFSPFVDGDLFREFLARGVTIDAAPRPHVFKSHLNAKRIPKGPGRYIYVMRNGLDVVVSWYHQSVRLGNDQSFPAFFDMFMSGPFMVGTWFDHVRGWLRNRHGLDVLYVTYEELRTDFLAAATRVANFIGVTPQECQWPRIVANCSFEFMRQHERKFDDCRSVECDPEDMHFIRRGRVGQWGSVITPEMLTRFKAEFNRMLGDAPVPSGLVPRA